MQFQVKQGDLSTTKTACLILPVFDRNRLDGSAALVDKAGKGALKAILKKGDLGEDAGGTQMLYDLPGSSAERVLLLSLGKKNELNAIKLRDALGSAFGVVEASKATNAAIAIDGLALDDDPGALGRDIAIAAIDAVYRFDACKSDAKPAKHPLKKVTVLTASRAQTGAARGGVEQGRAIGNGMNLAKDLGNLPGNICTPGYLANKARAMGRKHDKLKARVLDEAAMKKLGMGALLSVSRGSREPARFIIMEYKGGKAGARPVVLVGKGLTFDAGGISIKPAAQMDEMKYDMCGGASVFGAINACVEMALPLNVIGVVPSSENLPDGDANKPGDIVTSLSGQTIEVLNTDAEGRLILCDALTYVERFKPAAVVDIATLTGACIIALGHEASAVMGNDDKLTGELLDASNASGDRIWQLPLWEEYQKQLDSNFADMANIGGRPAGSITAGCFLSRFTKKYPWAHLDIAGTAWKSGKEKGATGRPVPLLTTWLIRKAGK